MEQRLRVSIVIPAYNEERHLAACLDAIAAQTSPVFEVIVVDNNSTDATAKIATQYSFVRVLKEPKQGRVFARNTGFDAVRGEIIGRIDADIRLPQDWVAHIQQFYSDPAHVTQAWSGGGRFVNVRMQRLVSAAYRWMAFTFNKLLVGEYSVWGSNMALLRHQWQNIRQAVHLRNDIHEDLDLALHLHEAGYHVVYDRSVIVSAHMRRVNTRRDELWGYLQWWPRTLRVHGKKTWVICWLIGGVGMYIAAYIIVLANVFARWLHRSRKV